MSSKEEEAAGTDAESLQLKKVGSPGEGETTGEFDPDYDPHLYRNRPNPTSWVLLRIFYFYYV